MNIYFLGHAIYIIEKDNKIYTWDSSVEGQGRHQTLPFIKNFLGYDEIEGMIISHFHQDHVGGASHIIDGMNGKVNAVYSSGVYSAGYGVRGHPEDVVRQNAFDRSVRAHNIPHHFVKEGDTIDGFIEILSPLPFALEDLEVDKEGRLITENPNDRTGIIARFNHGDFSLILTGDYNSMRDDVMLFPEMKATIMQIPHHGDRSYVNEEVIEAVSPSLAILGTASESRIEPLKTFLDDSGIDWWHIGYERDKRLKISGSKDGSYTIDENLPKYVKYNRASLL